MKNIPTSLRSCIAAFKFLRDLKSDITEMSPQREAPSRAKSLTREDLYDFAKNLATSHHATVSGRPSRKLYQRFRSNCTQLEHAYEVFAESSKNNSPLTPGAEWLLDNYHVVQKQITDIKRHFPHGYDRTLPKLSDGAYALYPRAYHIALQYLLHSDSVVDADLLTTFIDGYQQASELTIGELWAIPIMLRFALIENLSSIASRLVSNKTKRDDAEEFIDTIMGDETRVGTEILSLLSGRLSGQPEFIHNGAPYLIRRLRERGRKAAITLQWLEERLREEGIEAEELLRADQYMLASDQISIGHTFNSLRDANIVDWEKWFEGVSTTHKILLKDPAKVYRHCDFKTQDRYRHKIEKLANQSKLQESKIAQEVVDLAKEAHDRLTTLRESSPLLLEKRSHIGYYLLDNGRSELEQRLRYQPRLLQQLIRHLLSNGFLYYAASIAIATSLVVMQTLGHALKEEIGFLPLCALFALLTIAALDFSINFVQWTITKLLPPDFLPKIDLNGGIPESCRTVVVVQSLFTSKKAVTDAVGALEVRFLANPENNLTYGLLADLADAKEEVISSDAEIIAHCQQLISTLNKQYGDSRFFVLFRKRLWNKQQAKFMGWERKRGKIEEFNRLLLNKDKGSFDITDRQVDALQGVRFVVTLDSDSQLPRGVVHRLIGTIAHPLNRPMLDSDKTRIVEGHAIIQPRVGVSLTSAHSSLFAKIFAGHAGLDPYTQTVSEVYQDLFHEGSYIGKGIYDVEAFHCSLDGRIPENALLSHDMFEGLFAKTALATDIELFDDFPARYHVHAKRQHRWARGDWQLLPWLFSKVPSASNASYPNPLSALGRWKLFDNLRRSLVSPSLFVLLCLTWALLPNQMFYWTGFALIILAFPVFANLAGAFLVSAQGISFRSHVEGIGKDLLLSTKQTLCTFCLLPHQAYLMLHAIGVTLFRLFVSHRKMLEWETAQSAEQRLGSSLGSFIREMTPAIALVSISMLLVISAAPSLAFFSLPIFLLWIASPYVAKALGEPIDRHVSQLSSDSTEYLTGIGWKTWRYFRELMRDENNFVVPDNIQLVPQRIVAERTSPTNISLSILATISAHDLGFITLPRILQRLEKTFAALQRLEKYHGHFLNWYDTQSLQPLYPRYVSFVDSGNLVAHFIAAQEAFAEFPTAQLLRNKHYEHALRTIKEVSQLVPQLESELSQIEIALLQNFASAPEFFAAIDKAEQRLLIYAQSKQISESKQRIVLSAAQDLNDLASARPLFAWIESFNRVAQVPAFANTAAATLAHEIALQTDFSLRNIKQLTEKAAQLLRALDSADPLVLQTLEDISSAQLQSEEIFAYLRSLNSACEKMIREMDFRFLYDEQRNLFTIGYNLDNARRDSSYYDLLASEARLGSLVAVALGQIPQKHWFLLGRPIADSPGGKLLLSWSGTMFEFLMPILVTKDFPGTILSQTYRAVVESQRLYGKKLNTPWGISESAFSGIDFEKTYQYHAFGVPGLGLKRGLEDDLVISPYSTLLALSINIDACIENLQHLEIEGARGEYGFYEAIDYTPQRLSKNELKHVVQSFFAHHQGMSLISINNFLNGSIFQERFHRSPVIKATELLLQEKFPDRLPILNVQTTQMFPSEQSDRDAGANFNLTLNTPHTSVPRTHLLSNGHYTVMLDNAGSGFSAMDRDISLTRWREDAISNSLGSYIYIRDLETGSVWSTTYQPTCVEPETYEVVFSPDKADYKRRDFDIFTNMEVTVSPEDNVEVRRVSFTNLSSKRRVLEITSYAEVSLGDPRGDAAHPAFSKMFIESEFFEERQALVFSRRQRSEHDKRLYFLHMANMKTQWARVDCETSRFEFLGRGNSLRNPKALHSGNTLSGSVGHVLDPVSALRTHVEIESGATESINFIYAAATGRKTILSYASRYREPHQVSRAFEMAWSQSSVELRNERVAARQNQVYQRLGNAMLFNVEQFRADTEVLSRNHLAQSALWRFGISGDLPICLVHITAPEQTKLVQEVLLAHNYLRLRGLSFDLVILNEYPGGYLQALQEELEYLTRASVSGSLVDKKGGVFLRTMVQLSEDEKDLLFTVARVCLSGERGNLSSQIKFEEALSSPLYRKPTQPRGTVESNLKALEFNNGIGGFSNDGRSYSLAVGEQLPPLPWCNILSNPNFGTLVSESGASYTWADNCRENRITPWSNDPVNDPSPEVVYIRDTESGIFWCPTPRPVHSKANYDVEHSFGASTFRSQIEGIETRLDISIASQERVKWWKMNVKNTSSTEKRLEFFLYVDWALGPSREENFRFVQTGFDISSHCLHASNPYSADFSKRVSFIGSNLDIIGYSASKAEFIGRDHSIKLPLYLATQSSSKIQSRLGAAHDGYPLSRKTGTGFDPCGVIKVSLTLAPGKSSDVLFFLGQAESVDDMRRVATRYSSLQIQKSETKKYQQELNSVLSTVRVSTPERSFDMLMNGWLLYQVMNSRLYGRTGFYQSGGAFGYRDQLQDVLALLWSKPQTARSQILLHASRQFLDGDVQHWWHPPSGKGVRTKISDDFLWLPLVTARYIEATGDHAILDDTATYLEGPVLGEHEHEIYIVPRSLPDSGDLYQHCIKALERAMNVGVHGLPLMGAGDWNDGMNEVGKDGKGESVWMAWFLIVCLQEFLPLIRKRKDDELAIRYEQKIAQLRENIEKHAWDGAWYRRAYFDDGTPLGSASNTECKIDSISQSWGILSQAGDKTVGNPQRLQTAMSNVYKHLVDEEVGIVKLLAPPFDKSLPHPGYIKGYAPGIRENGGQYTHSAAWVIIATAMMGNGEKAIELINLINPINHTDDADGVKRYQGEPYVFCGDVYAVAPHQGRAGWSWYTGSASWIYQAGLHYILGLRINNQVLSFEPCVSASWTNFSAQLKWNNTAISITFHNPNGVQKGVQKVMVNGKEEKQQKIALTDYAESTELTVDVFMG